MGYPQGSIGGRDWTRIRRDAYVGTVAADGLDAEQRHLVAARAVAAQSHPDAGVSHVSAALVHGLPVWGVPLNRIHLTRARPTGGRRGRQVVLHSAALEPGDVVEVGGLRVTSPARTIIDLARSVSFESAVVTGDAALRTGAITRLDLDGQLVRSVRRRGMVTARRVVEVVDGRSESPGESRSRVRMLRHGLPEPVLQARVLDQRG